MGRSWAMRALKGVRSRHTYRAERVMPCRSGAYPFTSKGIEPLQPTGAAFPRIRSDIAPVAFGALTPHIRSDREGPAVQADVAHRLDFYTL